MSSREHEHDARDQGTAGGPDAERTPGRRTRVEDVYGWGRKGHADAPWIPGPVQLRSVDEATYRDDLAFDLSAGAMRQETSWAAPVQRAPTAGPSWEDRGPDVGPPPSNAPVKHDIRGRVVGVGIEGERMRMTIGVGTAQGVLEGMPGKMINAGGHPIASFETIDVKDNLCSAMVPMAMRADVRAHPYVMINPSPAGSKPVQKHARDAHSGLDDAGVQAAAAHGVAGAGGALPHLDVIQRAFGPHDVSGVQAHVGGAAREASGALGAHAYATGDHVAFAETPSLFLAAHEAAHVVQQRAGVSLSSAVGRAGDAYEQHADAVAAAVVRGDSAAELLAAGPSGGAAAQRAVQREADPLAASEGSSLLLANPLIATPARLHFGSVPKDETAFVSVQNQYGLAVDIIDVGIAHAGGAFAVVNVDTRTVPGFGAARIEVAFRPSQYTDEQATLLVQTADGATLQVPVTGTPATASCRGGELDVFPSHLELGERLVGERHRRDVVLHNRSASPIEVTQAVELEPSGQLGAGDDPRATIRPGARHTIDVECRPTRPGPFASTMLVKSITGEVVAMFTVGGEAVGAGSKGPVGPGPADDATADLGPLGPMGRLDSHPLDAEGMKQRNLADEALRTWSEAVEEATSRSYSQLRQDWIEYLTFAAVEPTISRASIPEAGVMRGWLQNAFGNLISDVILNVGERVPKAVSPVARIALDRTAKFTGAAVTFHQVRRASMLLGGGVAFVVGALVETLGGMLFDQLTPQPDIEAIVQEAHEDGFIAGASHTGAKIKEKVGELDAAQRAATVERNRQSTRFAAHIRQATTAEALADIVAELQDKIAEAAAVQAAPGRFKNELLATWLRDKAGSRANGVVAKQWDKAIEHMGQVDPDHFGDGGLKNQPDLFIIQCMSEWSRLGFTVPPGLQEAMYAEIGGTETLGDAAKAEAHAESIAKRFNGREFVFVGHVDHDRITKGLDTKGGRRWAANQEVTCRIGVVAGGGTCTVNGFEYRLYGSTGLEVTARSSAGGMVNRDAPREEAQHLVEQQVFRFLAKLQDNTLQTAELVREPDAAQHAELCAAFGPEIAAPRVQHTDGRPEPVTVYRVRGTIPIDMDPLTPTDEANGMRIVRAGNVIVIWEVDESLW
jgi:hypothetical protein